MVTRLGLTAIFVLAINIPNLSWIKLPTAKAAPGDGKMLLFWDGGTAPSGWTCVSCTGGDPFYQVFPRGNDTYGGTGGAASHTHTSTNSIDNTLTASNVEARTGTGVSDNGHSHSLSVTIGSASNLPSYRTLNIIRYNSNGEPPNIPSGAIGFFDTTLPSGWSAYSSQNGYYPYGESTAGTTGGSNTHNHALTITIGTATGGTQAPRTTGTLASAALDTHNHTASGNSSSVDQQPPFIEVMFGQATSTAAPPDGLIAMWDNDQPENWTKQSGSTGAFYQKFFKGNSTYGTTGGNATHTHVNTSITSSGPSATGNFRGGSGSANGAHDHIVHVNSYSTVSNLPPYKDVIIAKRVPQPTFEQSAYRFFANTDTADVGSPLAAQDTSATSPRQGKPFRLRMSLHVGTTTLGVGDKNFKLQYATRSGTCDTGFSGESYSDVGASGAIQYYNNASVTSGTNMTGNASDPVHSGHTKVTQTYTESNTFTSTSSISSGEDGVWDFALVDNSAPASTSYCFRIVKNGDINLSTYSVIPEITTDDGQGHMLLLWPGGAAPSGWTCISCSSGQDFYQKFFRGAASYGGTGGSASHTHTASGSVGASSSNTVENNSVTTVASGGHTHSFTPTISTDNVLPPYRQMQVIRADTSGVPTSIPANAIAFFDAAVPGGWTRYSAQDGSFVRGESTVGTTGGSATHTHTITGTLLASSGTGLARATGTTTTGAGDAHTHTVNGPSSSTNNEPPYIDTILGQISSTGSVPSNIIAMWDNAIPGTWTNLSTTGQPFNGMFVKGAATYGATGGAATHTPANTILTSTGPTGTVASVRTGTVNADSTHTHQVTISSFSSASNLPPYIDVIFAKLTGTNTAPNTPTSLDQQRTSDSSSISVGGYVNFSQVKFVAQATDPDNPDSLQLCVEVQQVGTAFVNTETACGTAASYTGTAVSVNVTISGLVDGASYHWQARIKDGGGATSAWSSFGGNAESAADFIVDTTAPSGTVYDGTTVGVDVEYNTGALDSLSSNWNITDGGSGVSLYEYSIGTTAGATDVVGWTSNGTTTSITANSLTLETSKTYYYNIRTTDVAGNQSIISSDGQLVAPTLSFSVSNTVVQFNNLTSLNNYTDSKTTDLTTSTNARNGYVIRSYAQSLLTSNALDTLAMFDGGTYASPDEWLPGDTGLGYTSTDTNVQGSNLFNPATCLGGGSGPCYAPYSITAPGDIIADHTAIVTGTPISNEVFTITSRVTANSWQSAGDYSAVIIYSATAIY